MQRIFYLVSLVVISLFLLSASKFNCYNAKIDSTGENSYIEYITIDGSNTDVRTYTVRYPDGIYEYKITTDKYKNKYIKDESLPITYVNIENGNDVGRYYVVNMYYFLDTFIENESEQTILANWIGDPDKPDGIDVFEDPLVLYAEDADYDSDDDQYEIPRVVSRAFYAKKTDVHGNGSRLIIETIDDLDVFSYEDVMKLQDAAQPITWLRLKNTVDVAKDEPNLQ